MSEENKITCHSCGFVIPVIDYLATKAEEIGINPLKVADKIMRCCEHPDFSWREPHKDTES